jgi:hypothetical protein
MYPLVRIGITIVIILLVSYSIAIVTKQLKKNTPQKDPCIFNNGDCTRYYRHYFYDSRLF